MIFDTLCFSVCYLFLHVPMDKGRGGGCPFDAEGKRRGGEGEKGWSADTGWTGFINRTLEKNPRGDYGGCFIPPYASLSG